MNNDYQIPAGLSELPRQIGMFPDFRAAMLTDIVGKKALEDWRARHHDDFGLMLLEMWAYCCDVLSFYDETIAHECYPRPARLRDSLRRLVDLLGYLPSPTLAASVYLAILAEGYQPVKLPAGTAFRSSAFPGGAPQVFETESAQTVYPQNNRWLVERPEITSVTDSQSLLLMPEDASVSSGDCVILQDKQKKDVIFVSSVSSAVKIAGDDGENYIQINLNKDIQNNITIDTSTMILNKTLRTATLWNLPGYAPIETNNLKLALNGIYPDLKTGDIVIIECQGEFRWFKAGSVSVESVEPSQPPSTPVYEGSTTIIAYTLTPKSIQIPATKITLDTDLNNKSRFPACTTWDNNKAGQMTLRYFLRTAGTLTLQPKPDLESGDKIQLGDQDAIAGNPTRFLLEDAEQNGMELAGTPDITKLTLSPSPDTSWGKPLAMPVVTYGNVVKASRGESVKSEILGSGDASMPNQSFKLKKNPLTYLADKWIESNPAASSTLKLYVNNTLWKEVPNFYDADSQDQVYIVRQNDDGETIITGGDGERGARFPTGADNIVAFYRFGAGAATPPAGSVTQLAKPVKGIKSVYNPVAAASGSDAQNADSLRENAPRSALLLGRAVSIQDFEAVAANTPGVRAASAMWCWNHERQQPVVQVWFIGQETLQKRVLAALSDLADPSVPIDVKAAKSLPRDLNGNIECDTNLEDRIAAAVYKALMDTDTGLLAPERIGIGKPLFRSRIFQAVLNVEGVDSISGLSWGSEAFNTFAKTPPSDSYFDFEKGSLTINGKAVANV